MQAKAICEDVDVEPQLVGGAEQWRVEPALPEGMGLDAQTGRSDPFAPSGSYTVVGLLAEATSYVVTASNEASLAGNDASGEFSW
eukprot:39043-Amphidinium_carterae.3